MKVYFSHPTGNANVRAAARGLFRGNLLEEFHTGIASFEGNFLDWLSGIKGLSEIKKRRFDKELQPVTRQSLYREACRLVSLKAGLHSLVQHETGWCSIEAVNHSLDKKVARRLRKGKSDVGGIYAYEDGALESFRQAKKMGLSCFYDLPAAYWRTVRVLMEKEKERWPDWVNTMNNFTDSNEKLRKKDEEVRLADCILVASRFTANSLQTCPESIKNIEVVPYGFPPVAANRQYALKTQLRPLKLLYVGKLSQQKGIANLFAAVNNLKGKVELTIVGSQVNNMPCKVLDDELKKHSWIPGLPHPEVLTMMRGNDVLVFPSISDGFGLVISEAMSQGTPVIASGNTAGPDLIEHGNNGWLCEAGSTGSLQQAIETIISKPSVIAEVGVAATETARRRPWMAYEDELASVVRRYIA